MGNSSSNESTLQVAQHCATDQFMGTWFVVGVKPTIFETTCSNAVEKYTRLDGKSKHDIDIDFQYNKLETPDSPLKSLPQKGWIQGDNKEDSALWKVSPCWPIKMPYLILEVDDKCQDYAVIGYPSRDYCWILSRRPSMPAATYDKLTGLLKEKHQYDLNGLRKVPQIWTKDERKKRGLTENEIPDDYLSKY